MKKLYSLFICASLFVAGNSFAQVNSYLLNDPVWQVYSSCAVPLPCIQNETYNYFVNGDTIFNSLTYKKIFRKGQGNYSWMAPPPNMGCSGNYTYTDTVPDFFIRSANKQMYIRTLSDTGEFLLYDFNLAVGDTLPISYNCLGSDITVSAIDSIFTPYGYRKRFALAGNTWATELIEGIGHSRGLVEPLYLPFECSFTLNCFSLGDTAYYPVFGPTCDLLLEQDEILSENKVSVFPNPFINSLKIQNAHINESYELSNAFGQLIWSGKNIQEQDFSSLHTGMYFLKIRNDIYSETLKLLKQ